MTLSERALSLIKRLEDDPRYSAEASFAYLTRLLAAPAPNNGAQLPGAVGDVIRSLAVEFGLSLSDDARIRSTGNLAIEIGAASSESDLVITAHMDRPSFRVLNLAAGTLYPLCAIRVPHDGYSCAGLALRHQDGRITRTARGNMHFREVDGAQDIRFSVESGTLQWGDTVMMFAEPQRRDGQLIGTGLDNASGVLLGLLSACALSDYTHEFAERGQKITFAFTDQEEGPPIGLFGQGAARLAGALPPPRLGFINIDAHNVDLATGHVQGVGASHAFVSGYGRGSVVPMAYQSLAETLAPQVNQQRPGTVRLNYGYVSRSDDMLLSLWARCLGLIGVPLENAHTTEETVALGDLVAALRWISVYVAHIFESQPN